MPFRLLRPGTKYQIYSEPTRGLRHEDITDTTVYIKDCDAWSTSADGSKIIILYPNDLIKRV